MSYDLRVRSDHELDLDRARTTLAGAETAGDELSWEREAVTATFLLTPSEIGIGVSGSDASRADRARDFEQAARPGARPRRPGRGARGGPRQPGRELSRGDVPDAVALFA